VLPCLLRCIAAGNRKWLMKLFLHFKLDVLLGLGHKITAPDNYAKAWLQKPCLKAQLVGQCSVVRKVQVSDRWHQTVSC